MERGRQVSVYKSLWSKLAASKEYREEFVGAQVKQGIPFQIRALLKHQQLTQEQLAQRASLSQGVVSRAADPGYGNLTLNTIIRIAAGFDVAFIGKFVPFSELGKWFTELDERDFRIKGFNEEADDAKCAELVHRPDLLENVIRTTESQTAYRSGLVSSKPAPEQHVISSGAANQSMRNPPVSAGSSAACQGYRSKYEGSQQDR